MQSNRLVDLFDAPQIAFTLPLGLSKKTWTTDSSYLAKLPAVASILAHSRCELRLQLVPQGAETLGHAKAIVVWFAFAFNQSDYLKGSPAFCPQRLAKGRIIVH